MSAAPHPPDRPLDPALVRQVQKALLAWFAREGSTELPWRKIRDPYGVLVSEFMLQQTQRDRVAPKFVAFMQQFPTLHSLAAATTGDVIRAWSGLGYNRRAVRLQAIARVAVAAGGELSGEVESLQELPGIGAYTAGAIACFGFGKQVAFVDTNVRRVIGRVFSGIPEPLPHPKRDQTLAAEVLPVGHAWEWNSALMDIGARICLARAPRCAACPLVDLCAARASFEVSRAPQGPERLVAEPRPEYGTVATSRRTDRTPFAASDRHLRGRIVEALRRLPTGAAIDLESLALAATGMALPPQHERVAALAARLAVDGLVVIEEQHGATARYRLPE